MSTLYLDRTDTHLRLEGGALVVGDGRTRRTIPVTLLERLVITAKTHLDSGLLNRLAEAGITVVLIDPRRSRRRAQLIGAGHGDARVRLAQYRTALDPAAALPRAQTLVAAKLRRQRRWLKETAHQRQDLTHTLETAARGLDAVLAQCRQVQNMGQLRGLEGRGGRVFFGAYRQLFPASLGFQGRRRRPPPDPVNAVLSLAYTLLHARAVQIAWAAGLDPLLGFYHQPAWGRESLACDLIEPWRPCIDAWVYRWFRERWLEAGHFSRRGDACLLGKAGRGRFFRAFESKIQPVHRAMRRQARTLIRELTS